MAGGLREFWHNPSSVHRGGQSTRHQVELAREALAQLVGARPRDIILTGGGTEAVDLAIRGVLGARPRPQKEAAPPNIITSRIEHNAVRDLVEDLEKSGSARVRWAGLDDRGIVKPESVGALIDADTALVAIQWANNETGAIQPVREIGAICRAAGVPFFCDGTQWVGKMPVDASGKVEDGAREKSGTLPLRHSATLPLPDLLSFSPHKFHGPKGVGVLVVRQGVRLRPVVHGTQELGRRGGTENVIGILGAGAAALEAAQWLADPAARDRQAGLRDRFEGLLLGALDDARVNGPVDPPGTPEEGRRRLWNTTNIAFPRLEAEALLMLLSEKGVLASAGAACSSGSLDPSPVLLAMGVPPELAHGSLRFSLSKHTTQREINDAAAIVIAAVRTLKQSLTSSS